MKLQESTNGTIELRFASSAIDTSMELRDFPIGTYEVSQAGVRNEKVVMEPVNAPGADDYYELSIETFMQRINSNGEFMPNEQPATSQGVYGEINIRRNSMKRENKQQEAFNFFSEREKVIWVDRSDEDLFVDSLENAGYQLGLDFYIVSEFDKDGGYLVMPESLWIDQQSLLKRALAKSDFSKVIEKTNQKELQNRIPVKEDVRIPGTNMILTEGDEIEKVEESVDFDHETAILQGLRKVDRFHGHVRNDKVLHHISTVVDENDIEMYIDSEGQVVVLDIGLALIVLNNSFNEPKYYVNKIVPKGLRFLSDFETVTNVLIQDVNTLMKSLYRYEG